MTKSEKEYVDMASKLAAQEAVKELTKTLRCNDHGSDLKVMKSTMKDNKNHIEENREHGTNDRRMIITGIAILIIGEIVLKIFL